MRRQLSQFLYHRRHNLLTQRTNHSLQIQRQLSHAQGHALLGLQLDFMAEGDEEFVEEVLHPKVGSSYLGCEVVELNDGCEVVEAEDISWGRSGAEWGGTLGSDWDAAFGEGVGCLRFLN